MMRNLHIETTSIRKLIMYKIHCFEPTSLEGFPSNTYVTSSADKVLECIRDLLSNSKSGISRIIVEDTKFGKSACYGSICSEAPQQL